MSDEGIQDTEHMANEETNNENELKQKSEADATLLSEARAYEDSLRELPTEEIWDLYHRKASKTGPRSTEIQPYRNALMERHVPLVKYIAERLL